LPHNPSTLVDPDAAPPGRSSDPRALAAVAAGGFGGTLARYTLDNEWKARPGHFPLATFTINLSGALAIAVLLVIILERRPANRYLRPFLATGILGGWTTMSTLAVDASTLARHGHPGVALFYIGATLLGSLVVASGGAGVARRWRRPRVRR